jgi:hypothetical protein
MFNGVRVAVLIGTALLLSACAGQPEIPFDKSTAGDIKTIGIVTMSIPDQPSVRLASDIGQSFGLIGALVDAGMESSRNSQFWAEIDGAHNPPPALFAADMAAALREHGYDVKTIDVPKRDSGFLKTYPPAADGHVDAYLDVTFIGIGYGYMAAGIGKSTPYRPFAYVNCRLVRASDQQVLMQDLVFYNPVNGTSKIVTVTADPTYTFTDFDALHADPKKARDGMDDAFRQTAEAIANLLH